MERIGIFGGSFNPFHEGHKSIALEAFDRLNLSRLIIVPAFQSVLKNAPNFKAVSIKPIQDFVSRHDGFSVDTYEWNQRKPIYTVDTLRYFKKKLGSKAVLFFLAGADILETFHRWKSPKEVLKLCRLVVMSRPGYKLANTIGSDRVILVTTQSPDISSTDIRKGEMSSKLKKK